MKSFKILMFALFSLSALSLTADEVKIGVLAKRGAVKAMQQWGATASYLSNSIDDYTFVIVPLSFDEVFPAIKKNEVDFFLVNSSMFVTAEVKYKAKVVSTMINSKQGQSLNQFGGVIITSVYNDDINELNDLKGHSFMAVKSSSFGGWQMAYKELKDVGINPKKDFKKFEYGGKHDNVVLAVLAGTFDAGTIRTDTIERMAAEGMIDMEEIKIVGEKNHAGFPFACSTALYPEWPLAKVNHTSNALAKQVAGALQKMKSSDKAAKDGKIVGWSKPLDYSGVETLQKRLRVGAYAK